MNQKPKYIKTSEGKTARVMASLKNNYLDYYLSIRYKTNLEKKEVAHALVDTLGEDIYSNVLNEIIEFLEKLEKQENEKTRRTQ